VIAVEKDYANLRIAAREYYEEGWAFRKAQRTLLLDPKMADRAGFISRSLPKRSVAEGYYEWIGYIAWLASMHEFVHFRDLLAIEAEGMKIIAAARDEFLRHRASCPKCGALNERKALGCSECGMRFEQ
jgi:hypothetical protein